MFAAVGPPRRISHRLPQRVATAVFRNLLIADSGKGHVEEMVRMLRDIPAREQAVAFGLFRFFDAAKPGPVGWADRCFKLAGGQLPGASQGWGILWDDFVAAGCTLLVIALWRTVVG